MPFIHDKTTYTNSIDLPSLVMDARAGAAAAWQRLYQYYYPRLYVKAMSLVENVTDARDLVQEAFITAYLKLPQLRDPSSFGPWIHRILNRLSFLQRQTRKHRPVEFSGEHPSISWDNTYQEQLDRYADQVHLFGAMEVLPYVLRITLLLRYFSAFHSYEQIASLLNIPVGTVRSRLHQGKAKLVEAWQRNADEHDDALQRAHAWNAFYESTLQGMHVHDESRNRLLDHFSSDLQMLMPNGKIIHRPDGFARMIGDDRRVGSWLTPVNIVSSGEISIVESRHFNSMEHPHHCPAESVMILHRLGGKVDRIQLCILQ